MRIPRTVWPLLLLVTAGAPRSTAGIPELELAQAPASELADRLADPARAQAALDEALRRPDAEAVLGRVAWSDGDAVARGWAIVGLARVPTDGASERLQALADDPGESPLVRTWAAAGRISRATTLEELGRLAVWQHQGLAALDRPLRLRAETLVGEAPLVDQLRVSQDPSLAALVADRVLAAPARDLVELMYTSPEDTVRRQAAAFAAAKGTRGEDHREVAKAVTAALAFRRAKAVPWEGGALYVPAVRWKGEDANLLVDALARWFLYLEVVQGKPDAATQVWNNLYSYQLLTACGYDMSLRRGELVQAVARVKGTAHARAMLADVGLEGDPRFLEVTR